MKMISTELRKHILTGSARQHPMVVLYLQDMKKVDDTAIYLIFTAKLVRIQLGLNLLKNNNKVAVFTLTASVLEYYGISSTRQNCIVLLSPEASSLM